MRSNLYCAKCYWPGVSEPEIAAVAGRAQRETRATARRGSSIDYLGSMLFPDDDLVLCLFRAVSRDAVLVSGERAGIPYERLMTSVWLPVPGPAPAGKSNQREC